MRTDPRLIDKQSLRVALPMLTLVPGAMGGTETYATALAAQLSQRADLLVDAAVQPSAEGLLAAGGDRKVRPTTGSSAPARIWSQVRSEFSSEVRATMQRADVVHYPLTVPSPRPPRGKPVVVTLHDTQHHDLADNFSRAERAYRRWRYDGPSRKADAVVTISEFCRERISANLGIPTARIHVAPLGVDQSQFSVGGSIRDDFVLYPARAWPHKNHRRLVEAMEGVRAVRPAMRLVLTGGGLDSLGPLPPWVEIRGLVPREELLGLYQRASCLAFPSLYEGFGLPPLEAMASGCPVAASSSGSLPEVCGDAAVLFDPYDAGAISRGILDALDHAQPLVARGEQRARIFTWDRCADEHARVYREVATSAARDRA